MTFDKEKIKQHGLTISISGIVSFMAILGAIWAASAQYAKLKADVDTVIVQNDKEHCTIKADTNKQYEDLKNDIKEIQKGQMEIIRAIGRLEGNK